MPDAQAIMKDCLITQCCAVHNRQSSGSDGMLYGADAPRPAGSQHQTSSRGSLSSVSQPASGSASGVAQSGPNLSGAASSSSPLQETQHAQAGNVSSVSQPPPPAAAAADVAIGNQQQESTGQVTFSHEKLHGSPAQLLMRGFPHHGIAS